MPKKSRGPSLKWRADRGCWEIVVYERGRRHRHSTGATGLAEAETVLREYLASRKQTTGPCDPARRIIGDVLADYVQEHGQFVKSPRTLSNCIDELSPFWGERNCGQIKTETCREYWAFRNERFKERQIKKKLPAGEVKPSVVARELSVLSAALMHDYRAGRLNLPVPVWKPKFDNRKDVWLSRPQAAALIRAARHGRDARGYLPLFILMGLYTAARHTALLSLCWHQVDLDRRLIDLHPRGEERTNKGKALIPIPSRLMTFLRQAKKKGTPWGPVIHENQRAFKSLKKTYGEAADRVGLVGVTPHTLRHTAASWMAQKGVPFPIIARYLGHADSRTTERIYAHHNPDYLSAATKALDNRPEHATKKTEHVMSMKKKKVKTKR